jgi:hypothetical protein
MRLDDAPAAKRDDTRGARPQPRNERPPQRPPQREVRPAPAGALADAFARALKR